MEVVRWGGGGRFRVAGRMRKLRGGLAGRSNGWKKGGRREEQGHRFIINLILINMICYCTIIFILLDNML